MRQFWSIMKLNFTCFLLALLISTVFVHVDSKKTKKSKSASKDRRTKSHSHTHSHSRSHEGTPGTDSESTLNANTITSDTGITDTRPGATIVLTSSGDIVPPYSQLTSSSLSTSNGLQCNGDVGATSAKWMLPNGESLEESSSTSSFNLLVRENPSVSEPNAELLRNSAGPIGINGVFWCIVEYSEYTDRFPVWILNESTPPLVTASSCEFIGLNPSDDTIGLYVTSNVSNGAPTTFSCSVGATSINVRMFRQVFEPEVPATEAGTRAVAHVPLGSVPGLLTCTVSNRDGSDSFTCDLQATSLGVPVISTITRNPQDSSVAMVAWSSISDPDGIFESYMVYVVSSSGIDYIPFQQIALTDSEARISGLYPGYSYQVTVVAVASSSLLVPNQVRIPSISAIGEISAAQCKPARGQNIEIKLTKLDDCSDECSETTTSNDNLELARAALVSCGTGEWNCTAMEPRITKVYCNENREKTPKKSSRRKSSTKTSTKQYEDIKIKAMAVCNACNLGTSSLSERTHRHRHTTTRHRSPRQIADSSTCQLSYEGCHYSVQIDTKSGQASLCGYSSISSNQDSCDCPDQCHYNYTQTCRNSCSCRI